MGSTNFLRATLLAAVAVTFGVAPLAAQNTGSIRGTVTAAAGNRPLAGAQVSIPGTGLGSLTNNSGQFLIVNVPAGPHTVRVQMIGYGTAEHPVNVSAGETAALTVTLREAAIALDEVVVTGTAATSRAREVGNSLDAISSREIANSPVVNAEQAIAGRVPGVTISASTGQPGSGGAIKIRGVNTVSQTNSPLIYVDGVRIFSEPTRAAWGARAGVSPLQDINAADIERMEVVKGAAATTLYGTEASGGVIQIFTKSGVSGAPAWNAEITTGFNQATDWGPPGDPTNLFVKCGDPSILFGLDVLNAYGPRGTRNDTVHFADPTCPADGDWTERGLVQRYNLSVRGGTPGVTYYLSGNFSDTDGILPTQNSTDGGLRGNFTFSPIDPLQIQLSTSLTRRNTRWVNDGNNAAGFGLNVNRGFAGNFKGGRGDDCAGVSVVCVSNAYIFDAGVYTRSDRYTTGLTVNYTPAESFSNRFSVGWDYMAMNNETHRPFGHMFTPRGFYWDENTRHTKLSLDYAGSFQNNFGAQLASTFSWGAQLFRDDHRWTEVDVSSFAGPGEPTLESGAVISFLADDPFTETTAGFFLQELLGFQDRLFITAGLRVDGNSAFGENFGLQPYPKLSLAYVLSDYDFWPTNWFDTFKLRAAVGESGKAPGAFDRLRTWQAVSGDNAQPGFSPQEIGNPDVGPERTREIEAGFDAGFFAGRLGLEATFFQANTFDALIPVRYPPSQGFLNRRIENVGEIRNRGFELQANAALLRTNRIDWRVRANLSLMESEAIDLDGDPSTQTTITTGLNSEVREGFPVPTYFGRRILNPNEFADPVETPDTVLGSVYPNRLAGFGTTLTLGNSIMLDALAEYQGGHMVQNYTGYQNARRGVWYPCYDIQQKMNAAVAGDASALNDVTAMERARCAFPGSGYTHDASYWAESADFLKLRHVSLSYTLPPRLLRFTESATITLSGQNLFTWTDYTGSDPETSDMADQAGNVYGGGEFGRRDYYQIPAPRTFLLSFKVGF